jgi:putative lipoprotein
MITHVVLSLSLAAPPDHWFGSDKLKHFFLAAFTQSVTYSALQLAGVRHGPALASAWAVTAGVSVGKELHDRKVTGLFSVRDLVWDAAGAGAATAVIYNAVRTAGDESSPASPTANPLPLGAPLLYSGSRGPILSASARP